MHMGEPNPATAATPPSTNVNPVILPLPPSGVESPSESRQQIDEAQSKRSKVEGQPSSTVGNLPETQRRLSLETRDVQVPKPLGQTTGKRPLARDSRSSAGVAATAALHNYRQSEGCNPDLSSAIVSAKMAAKEAQVVELQIKGLDTFANSAAMLAHKAALPVATPTTLQDASVHTLKHDATVAVHSAAALSAAKSTQQAATKVLAETEIPRKRKVMTGDLEEAAQKAAARRLALLDREFYEAGVLLRFPTPGGEAESRWLASLRKGSLVGETSPVKAGSSSQVSGLGSYSGLMDIAKRNVESRLRGIDVEVADKKGLVHRKDWNNKAMRIAEERVQNSTRAREGGKIDIGGGRCVDEEVVEAVALRRVQPVLQALTAKAEAERARVAAERAEAEERKRKEVLEKEWNRKLRQEGRRAKAVEKAELSRPGSEAKGERGAESRKKLTESELASVQVSSAPALQKSKLRKLISRLRGPSLKSTPSVGAYDGQRFMNRARPVEIAPRSHICVDKACRPGLDTVTQGPSHMEFNEPFGDRVEYIDTRDNRRKQTCAAALNPPNNEILVSTPGYTKLNSPLAVEEGLKGGGVANEPLHTLAGQTDIAPNTPVPETAVVRPLKQFEVHTVSNQVPVLAAEKPEAHVQAKEASIEGRETLGSPTVNEKMAADSTPSVYLLGTGCEKSKFEEGL